MSSSKDSFLQMIATEIETFYGICLPESTNEDHKIYLLSSFCGIYRKKLHVDFMSGRAVNYRVRHYLFGRKIS